jgi:hypothetical protein
MTVNAKSYYCSLCKTNHSISGLKATDYEFSTAVYAGQLFGKVDTKDLDVNDVLAFDKSQAVFKAMWDFAGEIYIKMIPAGIVLALVYFLLNLMEKVMQDNFGAEMFARELIKLVLMVLIVQNGFEIMTYMTDIMTLVYKKLATSALTSSGGICQYNACKNRDFFDSIGSILKNFFPYFGMSMAQFIIKIIAWSRILNLIVRVMFAPVGMADSVRGGTSSQGFRYLKKILACILQGALILAISVTYNMIRDTIIFDGNFAWVSTMVLAAVCVTLVFKTSSTAEEVLGA